jgi:alpha-beta hydrolase superfamily lysophospholipase
MATGDFRTEEGTFTSGGLRLFRRAAVPVRGAWARLVVLHGYGDHSGRYVHVLEHLARQGVACQALDFRGQGRSAGRRGYVRRWEHYLTDLRTFLGLPAVRGPGPLFLLGQSHGGLVLAAAAVAGLLPVGVGGCVLLAPYLRSRVEVSARRRWLGRLADRLLPWLPVASNIPPEWMCTDPVMIEETRVDSLVVRHATPRWYWTVQAIQDEVMRRADRLRAPLLVLFGEDDRVSDLEAGREFCARVGSADKEFRVYPGMRHELLRESRREEVLGDLLDWMKAHVGGPPSA